MRRASFWFTATTVDTVPTATHNTTLSPASRALERGRSVREYPTHVSDPMSSLGHAVWRFLLRRAAGRYAEHDLRAFHWLCYLLGQPRFSESFSRGAPRGSLWVRQGPSFRSAFLGRIACPTATTTAAHSRHPRATSTLLAETAGQRRHRELVLRFCVRFRPRRAFQHAIKPRNAVATAARTRGLRRRCRPAAPTPQSQPGLRISVLCRLKKSAPSRCGAKTQVTFPSHTSHTVY